MLVYPIGTTAACTYAASYLHKRCVPIVDHPTPEVTHLLLDVPSFSDDGALRGGGEIGHILRMLPRETIVAGGNLEHNDLKHHRTVDFLQDETYLAENAAITAECALQVAAANMDTVFSGAVVLITGWGRIAKCLAFLLKGINVQVIIAARKESDRAMAKSLGFEAVEIAQIPVVSTRCSVLFNTVPEVIYQEAQSVGRKPLLKIELASRPGIVGEHVIPARGLPGTYAPKSSGRLIGDTFLRLCKEG